MLPAPPQPRRRWLTVGLLLVTVIVALGAWRARATRVRPVAVVVSGDTAGWITPCGCTANQSGGLLRRGTLVTDLRRGMETVVVDVGGAPGGSSDYHKVKFEAVLQGELAMGLAAHNLGGPELSLGTDYLRRIGTERGVPFVSANVRDDAGAPLAEPARIVTAGRRRLAFVGVVSPRYAVPGVQIGDPREAVLRAAADLHGQYDTLTVLAYLPEEELRALAAGLPEADVVVGGPTGQSIRPDRVGPTLLASATNKGKFLLHLVFAPGAAGWSGDVIELDQRYSDEPGQQANFRRYLDVLADKDFPAAATGFAPSLPASLPANYRYAGNQTCAACHAEDCAAYAKSKHIQAWHTLAERGSHVDPYCQRCHATGYGQPGGFESVALSSAMRSVGCESCHGPSQAHNRNPKVRTPFAARDQCITCHDRENSPTFAYDQFWPRIAQGAASNKSSGRKYPRSAAILAPAPRRVVAP